MQAEVLRSQKLYAGQQPFKNEPYRAALPPMTSPYASQVRALLFGGLQSVHLTIITCCSACRDNVFVVLSWKCTPVWYWMTCWGAAHTPAIPQRGTSLPSHM